MAETAGTQNPFGNSISTDDILDTLGFFDSWEDRYKYIIDLGKDLPPMAESLHTEDRLVRGCQSQVWIDTSMRDGRLQLTVDSDAFIVKGLLGLVLAAYNNKTPAEIAVESVSRSIIPERIFGRFVAMLSKYVNEAPCHNFA